MVKKNRRHVMKKPRIVKVTYEQEMPEESALLFYKLIETFLLRSLPDDPTLKGLYLKSSFEEFTDYANRRKEKIDKED